MPELKSGDKISFLTGQPPEEPKPAKKRPRKEADPKPADEPAPTDAEPEAR